MTDWAALRHAYGAADDIPDLLVAAEYSDAEDGPAWDELWSRLCHQGTVYPASYAALPYLAEIADRHAPAGYIAALDLASAMVASTDGPADQAVVRQEHTSSISRLRGIAERSLSLAEGVAEFVCGLQALMACEDGGVWQRRLSYVADGELPVECPRCRKTSILGLDGPPFTLASYQDSAVPPTPVRPVKPGEGSTAERMLALAERAGQFDVVGRLRYACGDAICPNCGSDCALDDALT